MNRQLSKNRTGVSTVIGTILMIMVVMVGMSILFGGIIVYSDSFQEGRGSSVLESITVEDVYFKSTPSPNYVELTLFNTGKVELKVTNVYIDGQMATLSPDPLTIPEGEHRVLKVTPTGESFAPNNDYHFKIVTSRGTGFEGTYTW
jgi:hypothetical protein